MDSHPSRRRASADWFRRQNIPSGQVALSNIKRFIGCFHERLD
jgi:hypothetical protein